MPQPLEAALGSLRELLLDDGCLVRAVAAGRHRGVDAPARTTLRPVELKAGRMLQVVREDPAGPHTRNLSYRADAAAVVDDLLAEPFGNWHIETTAETVQLRVTKKGTAQLHRATIDRSAATGSHDRQARHLLDPGDPLFGVIGGSADKRRQVDAFLRALVPAMDVVAHCAPLRVVDLGCGNAYLTFGAYRYLADITGRPVDLTGVDARPQARERNTALADRLGWASSTRFLAGTILDAPVEGADVVLALHACDTATDEALARAVRWRAPVVLAAPCCHHDLQRQLRGDGHPGAPGPYGAVLRSGILRERMADVLTDALRASLLRLLGYRVDVIQFVDSTHTARNVLLRAVRTDAPAPAGLAEEYAALTRQWGVRPALERLLADELADVLAAVRRTP